MNQPVLELVKSAEDEFYNIIEYYKELTLLSPMIFCMNSNKPLKGY